MNKAELIEYVHSNFMADATKTQTEEVVGGIFATIKDTVVKGKEVSIAGFGKFSTRKAKARTARNPRTGAEIAVPAKTKVKFTVAKDFKDAAND